jgi:hypothetical protein
VTASRHRWSRERLGLPTFSISLRDKATGEFFPLAEELKQVIHKWVGPLPRGRPSKDAEHQLWADVFVQLRDELNGSFEPVNGEPPLSNMELSQLVKDTLGLSVTKNAVWDAVKDRVKPDLA